MATAFNSMGSNPLLTGNGSSASQLSIPGVGGTPAGNALNNASLGQGLSFSPTGQVATTVAQPTPPPNPAKDWNDYVTNGFLSPSAAPAVKSHSVSSAGDVSTTFHDPSKTTGNAQNVPVTNPSGGTSYVSGTPDALPGAIASAGGVPQTSTTQNNPVPVPTPASNSYGGLINKVADVSQTGPFVTQAQALLKQQQGLASQLGPALATITNTPGLLGSQNARAANVTNAYGSEMQGLANTLAGANTAQSNQQSGLINAGQMAAPANTNVTPPQGSVTTNTLTGQQYSNPVLAPVGTQQFYSPQPTGTTGQPATAGQPQQYAIQSGDTFYKLAGGDQAKINAIEAANPGVDPNNLQPGQKINMPETSANTPFSGGQAQAQAGLGATYTQNNATIIAAQGIQQKLNSEIVSSGINSLSSLNVANALNQWIQGNVSNPAYQNFFQDLTDYTQTIAPLIGITGTVTDMKTAIGQSLISSTASGETVIQGLNNLNTLAINKNEAMAKAGQGSVGQGATPTGQNTTQSNSNTYSGSLGTYHLNPATGKWE